jgi:hypothetical protein
MTENMGEEKKVIKIERIEKADVAQKAEVGLVEGKEAISKTKFDAALEKADAHFVRTQQVPEKTIEEPVKKHPSPIVELSMSAKKIQRLEPVTEARLIASAEDIKAKMQAPVERLQDTVKKEPNLKLSPVYEAPLSERLIHIDASLKSALGVAGAEVKAPPPLPTKGEAPLVRFLNYLTHGDRQLSQLVAEVQTYNTKDEPLTPAKLLAIQIKLNFVQQELEFFTNVLNKALESTKTLMNIQI